MYRVSKTVVKQTEHPELFSLFNRYGVLATNLYNAGLFRVRQNFTMHGKEVLHPLEQEVKQEIERTVTGKNLGHPRRSMSYLFLEKLMRVTWNPDFFAGLPMQCAQNVLKQVCGDFKNWMASCRQYKKDTSGYLVRPKMPHYKRKKSLSSFTFTNQDCSSLPDGAFCGIDLGVDNTAALVSSNGRCVLYKGGALKSANQWYNKQMADCRSLAMKGHTADEAAKLGLLHTKKMQSLSRRRNQFFHDTMHKIASDIVHFCLTSGITTIVIGKNKNWKQKSNIGHVNNQNFVQIPLETLRWMITYKAESAGLIVVEQEESYTSKASLVDGDEIPVYGKETKNLVAFSGRRIKRGLYRTGSGQVINADLNGAGNILLKYIPDAFKDRKDFAFLDQILVRNYPCLNKRIPVKGIGAA